MLGKLWTVCTCHYERELPLPGWRDDTRVTSKGQGPHGKQIGRNMFFLLQLGSLLLMLPMEELTWSLEVKPKCGLQNLGITRLSPEGQACI